ncbi:ABC-2 transporter protein [Halocaridina rubra]|uniref:ABC-2 transporter protein n=1 Tax=Halocaridina rubra TaxID=373956 RepID=A0AAN8X015_HALRR
MASTGTVILVATLVLNIHERKKSDKSNYRSVSLTSVICKTMETITRDHNLQHLNLNEFLQDCQYRQEVPVNMTLSFNDSFVHSLPILTNLLSNTILSAIGNSSTISILSQMLPQLQGEAKFDVTTFFAPFMIGMTFTIVPCGLAMDIVADREIGVRNMMRLNGVGFHLYFSSSFLVMGAMYIICYISLLIIIAAFNLASLMIPPAFAAIAILYLLYMPVALLYSGVFGYIFDKAETARQFYPSIATTIGMLCYNAVSIVDMTVGVNDNGVSVAKYIHYVVTILFPHYIPFGLLYYINKIYILCSIKGDCSSLTAGDYMTGEIIVMFVMLLIDIPLYYILLRLADTLKLGGSWREALWIKSPPPNMSKESGIDAPTNEDDDVIAERAAVSASLMNGGEVSPAIIYDLGKAYKAPDKKENPCKPSKKKEKEFVALKSVSLEVKAGQVFGLLGPNGAGKTTSLRIMTAQEKPSKGRVQICGKEIVSSLSEVFANLGYCPQHDALWRNITVAEHIQVLADIRGVREDQVKPISYCKKGRFEEVKGYFFEYPCIPSRVSPMILHPRMGGTGHGRPIGWSAFPSKRINLSPYSGGLRTQILYMTILVSVVSFGLSQTLLDKLISVEEA